MAVRFKFRSSVDFDSVDIEGQPSISVYDLRIKIIRQKNLNLCQDSDLVLSDASNGQEYNDENFQIPSGASVIVRRVPAGSVPSVMASIDSVENFGIRNTNLVDNYVPLNLEVDDFDDFGDDLCPAPDAHEANLSGSDLVIDKKICIGNKKLNIEIPSAFRCFEPPTLGCHKPEASVLSDAISGGPAHSGIEGNTLQTLPIAKVEEHLKSENFVETGRVPNANLPTMENADLPSELKCSLCHTFFKDAVMIPCCQHSFCEKCIRLVLVEKARCPKCLTTKCSVGDLLPNVSLRQAIQHFLESQNLISGPDNALQRYAPDGESGIQAKEMSCAMTILQREQDFPHSPSVTGRGSNQIMTESAHVSMLRNNTLVGGTGSRGNHLGGGNSFKTVPLPDKAKQIDAETHELKDLAASAEFQGESDPGHEKAESTVKKNRGLYINTAGGVGSFMETGRHRKGDRTCYMCGSPLHFVRDCPVASSSHPMLQSGAMPGYVSPYWGRTPLPHVRPFANLYGNPGMMPFNVAMVPPTPYVIPTYMPSMYGGLPTYGGFTRMGGAGPALETGAERHLGGSEFLEFQGCEKRRKVSNQTTRRELSFDDDYTRERRYEEAERPHEQKAHLDREKIVSYSDDSFTQRRQRNKQRDNCLSDEAKSFDERHGKSSRSSIADRNQRPYYHSERSSSEVEDMSGNSNWHSEEKHKRHHKISRRRTERMEQCDIDSNRSYHQTNKERDVKRKRVESDVKRHNQKHLSRSESDLEPSFATDLKKHRKEKDSMKNEMGHDRWRMVSDSDEDGREDYRYHKRKRGH